MFWRVRCNLENKLSTPSSSAFVTRGTEGSKYVVYKMLCMSRSSFFISSSPLSKKVSIKCITEPFRLVGTLWVSLVQPHCSSRGSYSQTMSRFEYLKGQWLHKLSGIPVPLFDHSHSFFFFFYNVPKEFHILVCAHCLSSFEWALLGRAWFCHLHIHPLYTLIRSSWSIASPGRTASALQASPQKEDTSDPSSFLILPIFFAFPPISFLLYYLVP